jgi:transcriptional regulator with XRE-family HTH domain
MSNEPVDALRRRHPTTLQTAFGLTDAEVEMFDCRIGVSKAIRAIRRERGLTQPQMAELTGLSQARISMVERNDVSVSFGLMVEAYLALGNTRQDLAEALADDISRPDVADSAPVAVKRSPRAKKLALARSSVAAKRVAKTTRKAAAKKAGRK